MISPSQRPLPDHTQHSHQTNIHALGGIRTHDRSRRAAVDLRLRSRGYWDRLYIHVCVYIYIYNKTSIKRNIVTIKQNTSGSRSGLGRIRTPVHRYKWPLPTWLRNHHHLLKQGTEQQGQPTSDLSHSHFCCENVRVCLCIAVWASKDLKKGENGIIFKSQCSNFDAFYPN